MLCAGRTRWNRYFPLLAVVNIAGSWLEFWLYRRIGKIIEYHRPEEKTRVQSLNDFVVFGVMIVGSFSSGALLGLYGWNAVLWGSLVPVGLAFLGIINELRAKRTIN